jgi:hypothetical protein
MEEPCHTCIQKMSNDCPSRPQPCGAIRIAALANVASKGRAAIATSRHHRPIPAHTLLLRQPNLLTISIVKHGVPYGQSNQRRDALNWF